LHDKHQAVTQTWERNPFQQAASTAFTGTVLIPTNGSSPSRGSQHSPTFGEVFLLEGKVQLDRQFNENVLCFVLQDADKSHIHPTFMV